MFDRVCGRDKSESVGPRDVNSEKSYREDQSIVGYVFKRAGLCFIPRETYVNYQQFLNVESRDQSCYSSSVAMSMIELDVNRFLVNVSLYYGEVLGFAYVPKFFDTNFFGLGSMLRYCRQKIDGFVKRSGLVSDVLPQVMPSVKVALVSDVVFESPLDVVIVPMIESVVVQQRKEICCSEGDSDQIPDVVVEEVGSCASVGVSRCVAIGDCDFACVDDLTRASLCSRVRDFLGDNELVGYGSLDHVAERVLSLCEGSDYHALVLRDLERCCFSCDCKRSDVCVRNVSPDVVFPTFDMVDDFYKSLRDDNEESLHAPLSSETCFGIGLDRWNSVSADIPKLENNKYAITQKFAAVYKPPDQGCRAYPIIVVDKCDSVVKVCDHLKKRGVYCVSYDELKSTANNGKQVEVLVKFVLSRGNSLVVSKIENNGLSKYDWFVKINHVFIKCGSVAQYLYLGFCFSNFGLIDFAERERVRVVGRFLSEIVSLGDNRGYDG